MATETQPPKDQLDSFVSCWYDKNDTPVDDATWERFTLRRDQEEIDRVLAKNLEELMEYSPVKLYGSLVARASDAAIAKVDPLFLIYNMHEGEPGANPEWVADELACLDLLLPQWELSSAGITEAVGEAASRKRVGALERLLARYPLPDDENMLDYIAWAAVVGGESIEIVRALWSATPKPCRFIYGGRREGLAITHILKKELVELGVFLFPKTRVHHTDCKEYIHKLKSQPLREALVREIMLDFRRSAQAHGCKTIDYYLIWFCGFNEETVALVKECGGAVPALSWWTHSSGGLTTDDSAGAK